MVNECESSEEIQKKIKEKGLKWEAGKTSMSELTPEEQASRLGLIPTEEEKATLKKKEHNK